MIQSSCTHGDVRTNGKDRHGNTRFRCKLCGKTWVEVQAAKPLGTMTTKLDDAKLALRLLVEGNSIRATERISGLNRNTICKLLVKFGEKCHAFMNAKMHGLKLEHLEIDEQWTYVAKKQSRLTMNEREERHDIGDVYLWTALDQKTKLMPCFLIGKRSADNARRFLMDISGRLVFPNAHASDAHSFAAGGYTPIVQISTDGFNAYPEAVDLAFGPYVKFGTIVKEFKNASMIYTPSEMVGTIRKGRRGFKNESENRTICTSHVERLNGTQRLFMKRLNRLTVCFSKKLRNLQAAFSMFVAYYNFCWQTRKPGKSGQKRATAAMMAGIAGHVWSFDELFEAVLAAS